MPLPASLRVKLSSEAAGSISITPVVVREMEMRELIEEILPLTGKDAARIAEYLMHGTLVSGGSRFRWTGFSVGAGDLEVVLSQFPDADPARIFDPGRCASVVLTGRRRSVEVSRDIGSRRPFFRRTSFWDELMHTASAGELRYREYSYRRRADVYAFEFSPADVIRITAATRLVRYSTLRRQLCADPAARAELFVAR